MLFDFASFLLKLDPSQSYTIKQLTGGVVNVTVRAVKSQATKASAGRFPEHGTMILKYAPPYIAGLGESAPFSQARQVCIGNKPRCWQCGLTPRLSLLKPLRSPFLPRRMEYSSRFAASSLSWSRTYYTMTKSLMS